MPRYILKLQDRYFEWSTVVDAPVGGPWTREQALAHVTQQIIEHAACNAQAQLAFCDLFGVNTDQRDFRIGDLLLGNRAGPNESELTAEEIYQRYSPAPKGD